MQYLLSRASRPVLTRLGHEQTLCAFDFDGTLAPIVANPTEARMHREVCILLAQLAERYPCIVISGRARADLLEKLDEVRVARVIGNHGAETELTGNESRQHVRQWQMALASSLRSIPGLWIENKGLSLTVHYRQSAMKLEARRRIDQVVRTLQHVRMFGGKQVVNLVEADAPHKGDVLAAERVRLACKWVLYVGDDVNDEDAFDLTGNVVSVRIGRKRMSHARYYLRTQSEIRRLLELLCIMRPNR
jgi:trehalose 6-phosphate phosphatase